VARRVPRATPKLELSPAVAALRLGERIRGVADEMVPPLVETELAATPVAAAQRSGGGFDPSLVMLAGVALGALLLVFSLTPDPILVRSFGLSAVRARFEVGLLGGAIVALATAMYLIAASS
jgi:hypothetical protein